MQIWPPPVPQNFCCTLALWTKHCWAQQSEFLIYPWFQAKCTMLLKPRGKTAAQELTASRNPRSHHGPRAWVAGKMQRCFPLKWMYVPKMEKSPQKKGRSCTGASWEWGLTCSAQAIDTLKPKSNRIFITLIKNLTISWFNIRHPRSLMRNDINKTKAGEIRDSIYCPQQ